MDAPPGVTVAGLGTVHDVALGSHGVGVHHLVVESGTLTRGTTSRSRADPLSTEAVLRVRTIEGCPGAGTDPARD